MDDSVIRAMELWPNVPECYGWLRLDRRGRWLLTRGDGAAATGEPISNRKVIDFIGRNYARRSDGAYYFQNGPQRVFVQLAHTPYVVFASQPNEASLGLEHHTGAAVEQLQRAWIDETGALLLQTQLGIALVDDRDVALLLAKLRCTDGQPLSTEQLEQNLLMVMAGEPAAIALQWQAKILPLEPLRSDEAEQLGFSRQTPPVT